jgi:hypothetical protein
LVSCYRKVYDHAINCAYELNNLYPEQNYASAIFKIMESTKYALLLEELSETKKIEKTFITKNEENEDKKAMSSNQSALTLIEAQRHLTSDMEVFEYYWGDSAVFVMGIVKDKIKKAFAWLC